MIKQLTLCTKRPDISHEQCIKHHREIHMPLVKSLLGQSMHRYIAHYVDHTVAKISTDWTEVPPRWDIVVESWREDEAWKGLADYFKTPQGRQIPEDEKLWLDQGSLISLVCHEYQII